MGQYIRSVTMVMGRNAFEVFCWPVIVEHVQMAAGAFILSEGPRLAPLPLRGCSFTIRELECWQEFG